MGVRQAVEKQAQAATRQAELAESGQVTERLSRAVDQLAHEEEGIQLGGIYALERIYRDSVEHRAAVTEVLAAAVRARSNVEKASDSVPTIAAEAVAVLARREIADETPSARLQGAYLKGATLPRSNLFGAILIGADLFGADLTDADLTDADLTDADLTNAQLTDAQLAASRPSPDD